MVCFDDEKCKKIAEKELDEIIENMNQQELNDFFQYVDFLLGRAETNQE